MDKLAWLSRLISFNTISAYSNKALIDCLHAYLSEQGFHCALTDDVTKEKANLFATLPGKHPYHQTAGGLILSGHTDVVPVAGQAWDSDPFQAVQRAGRIYGRGACDMKGFLAVVLGLVPAFKALSLNKPLHLAFSYDEEVGCHGAAVMIHDLQQKGVQPAACIVGEPSNMQLVVAHKGIRSFCCQLQGLAVHSSLTTRGCNAIEYAAALISFLRTIADTFKINGPFELSYDVPFTTVSTNMITGGNASNTVPAVCEVFFEFRHLPQDQAEVIEAHIRQFITAVLLPKMRREYTDAAISLAVLAAVPSFSASVADDFYQMAASLLPAQEEIRVAYATEAGLFQAAHIPTLICGPGSIEEAHRPNEYVAMDQLNQCEDFVYQLVKAWCTTS